jgi:hypothetical protein
MPAVTQRSPLVRYFGARVSDSPAGRVGKSGQGCWIVIVPMGTFVGAGAGVKLGAVEGLEKTAVNPRYKPPANIRTPWRRCWRLRDDLALRTRVCGGRRAAGPGLLRATLRWRRASLGSRYLG